MQIGYQKETIKKNNHRWFPKIGERVRLTSINKAGEVLEISEDNMQLTVLCGVFRSTVDLSAVESLDGHKPLSLDPTINISANTPHVINSTVRTKNNTLDVRGLRVHEAEAVIEEKLRHTVGPLWVIHGIGTGKLKKGLLQWLEGLDYVEKVTNADQIDGGLGCSVIWMR